MPALVILQTLTGTFEDSFQFFMLSFFVFGVVLTNRFIIIAVVVIVVMLLLFGFGFGFGVLLC
jgi:Sec-independent protein secretion pathway component TatC